MLLPVWPGYRKRLESFTNCINTKLSLILTRLFSNPRNPCQKSKGGQEINEKFGINRYTLLYIKLTKYKDLFVLYSTRASLVAQTVKNLPATQETWIWSLHQEDPLEKKMATHSSILAWIIPWTEETGRLHSIGSVCRELGMTEGNGTPLQYSCLENPMDWWATVHGIAKIQTWPRD